MSKGAAGEAVSFELEEEEGENMYTAIFVVPRGLESQLVTNSVNARGASFALSLGPQPGTIVTTFYSSEPEEMAEAIRVRLLSRVQDPSPPGAENCSIM
mmetsp:Transcript_52105/g.104467  ORF Transcript_52105/g.104467 Transcript_52105/m.104467 type:complete len:99 (-) Transcript_52105:316-612(-)|eukprot:CAMPEP_0171631964 /NCGR_PEP_ID=MMETSP0990-20121206/24037_1 /TAXON_ID=483369 /ORGANISM="non described non described, Strain CCMP2098" /LENGTH=98 /DNA_ID=CAMNT_0012201823 /DNA_START=46 /DNA_END=342 /DNA_ORIENTATION=+